MESSNKLIEYLPKLRVRLIPKKLMQIFKNSLKRLSKSTTLKEMSQLLDFKTQNLMRLSRELMAITQTLEELLKIVITLETQLKVNWKELIDGRMIKPRESLKQSNRPSMSKKLSTKSCKARPLLKLLEYE